MKAEHRHELKTNDLSKALITAGDYFRVYGGRIALALAIVILGIILINLRISRSRQNTLHNQSELAIAQSAIRQFQTVEMDPMGMPTVDLSATQDVRNALRSIQNDSSDDQIVAQALLAEGDLNWALANYPELPSGSPATTRAGYKLEQDRSAYLKEAADLYQQVIERYSDQMLSLVNARFGLAAVAEQNSNWDEARAQYEQVTKLADEYRTFRQFAEGRLNRLGQISKPMLIGEVPEKEDLPPLPPPDPFDLNTPSTFAPGVSLAPATTGAASRAAATGPATK